jgi:hypothetical protein
MTGYLYHKLSVLHQRLLAGELSGSLHWSDALELIRHLGQVEPRGDDDFAFVVGTRRELFKRSRTLDFGVEEVSRLRTFLENAGSETVPIMSGRDLSAGERDHNDWTRNWPKSRRKNAISMFRDW